MLLFISNYLERALLILFLLDYYIFNIRCSDVQLLLLLSNFWVRLSEFGNPFKLSTFSRAKSLTKYEEYVRASTTLMAKLPTLKSRLLGCFCHNLPCHGDILIKLIVGL